MMAVAYSPLTSEDVQDNSRDPLTNRQSSENNENARSAVSSARSAKYYGETDHPASEDEDEALLDKVVPISPATAELGEMHVDDDELELDPLPQRSSVIRYIAISLGFIVAFAAIVGITAGLTYKGSLYRTHGVRHITMDHIFNGTFTPVDQEIGWVPEAGDGVYATSLAGFIRLVDLGHNSTRILVAEADVKDEHGAALPFTAWKLSPNLRYILFEADYRKQWRNSHFSNYYVHNLETRTTIPIIPATNPPTTSYATWSPSGEFIAYVSSNDIYIKQAPFTSPPIRVTTSGNASLFHGVTDWVYEEEVFSSNHALWWSPDSNKIAFLRFDETAVDEFKFPIYNPTDDSYAVTPYTHDVVMRYPKPGYNNPLVTAHVFDLRLHQAHAQSASPEFPFEGATLQLDWEDRHAEEDSIISEVAWVANDTLIVRELNRNADDGNVVLFDLREDHLARHFGRVVRKLGKVGEEGDDGWVDCVQNIRRVPESLLTNGVPAYLDIVPSPEGFNHIALFSPADSSTPRFLTSGNWEVTSGINAIDAERGLIYFQAVHARSSTERHIYSIPISTAPLNSSKIVQPTSLTDPTAVGFYDASFSSQGGFYVLSYRGPNIPWQKIVKANDSAFNYLLTDNRQLNLTFGDFETPVVAFSEIENDGYKFNVKEIRPPNMDDTGRTKHAVLFHLYNGPDSQTVDLKFRRDWHHYLACGLQYVVVMVDGRGTGFKGRKYRNVVKGNLGYWETRDQIAAAKLWATKPYVDPKRIGIWGWSYGAYMSAKVVEANAKVHSLAMSVAPVTSWELYDTIYTERYMNLPALNREGYHNASISNVTGFHDVDYLLMHGSADDNVHFAHSARMLDMLTSEKVRKFRFRMFTDSDHSIQRRGASREVYEYMVAFLTEKWGKGGRRRTW